MGVGAKIVAKMVTHNFKIGLKSTFDYNHITIFTIFFFRIMCYSAFDKCITNKH